VRPIGPGGRQTTALRYPHDFPSTPACAPCAFQCRDKIRSPSNLCNMANYEQASICGSVSWRPVIGGAFPRTGSAFWKESLSCVPQARHRNRRLSALSGPGARSLQRNPQPTQLITISSAASSSGDPTKTGTPPRATPAARGVTEPPKPINAMAAP
jgi:hypothetical protein